MARDGCCQYPGCQRARYLHAHHLTPWSLGGASDLTNLILLCARHHTITHEASLTITKKRPHAADPAYDAGDRWTFTTPTGHVLTAEDLTAPGTATAAISAPANDCTSTHSSTTSTTT